MTACASAGGPAPSATPDVESQGSLWIPRRIGSFHLAVYYAPESDSGSALYRYVGPDSVLMDVTLSPGPDLKEACPVDCAQAEAQAYASSWRSIWEGESDEHRARDVPLARGAASPWSLAVGVEGTAADSARFVWRAYYLPRLRMEIQGRYEAGTLRSFAVAQFLYYVMPAFSTPPVPLPGESRESVIEGFVGSWDFVGSPVLCGPAQHRISVQDSLFLVSTPRVDGRSDTTRYVIQRAGSGLIPGETHVLRIQRVGERARGAYGELVAWDLIMDSADRFRWRRNDWYYDQRSADVLRCDRGPF